MLHKDVSYLFVLKSVEDARYSSNIALLGVQVVRDEGLSMCLSHGYSGTILDPHRLGTIRGIFCEARGPYPCSLHFIMTACGVGSHADRSELSNASGMLAILASEDSMSGTKASEYDQIHTLGRVIFGR
jgi:hypothetical protein